MNLKPGFLKHSSFVLPMASLAIFLVGCHSIPDVRSYMDWNSLEADSDCIKRAINATKGVQFESQFENQNYSAPKTLTIRYKVLSNKQFDKADIDLHIYKKGILVQHHGSGSTNSKISETDKEGFKTAIKAVNENLVRFCPQVKNPTEPIGSKPPIIFQ